MNRAQHPQRLRTSGGDGRTSNKARGMGGQKAPPHCHPKSSYNPHGSSLTQGAEPSEPLQAIRCRRSTENTREGLQPNLGYATRAAVGQVYGVRKGRSPKGQPVAGEAAPNSRPLKKSTAQGGKPRALPKTPQTQQTELHRRSRIGNRSQKR